MAHDFESAVEADLSSSSDGDAASPTSSSDDEPPPSIIPKSNGSSWWFRRQGARETLPPPSFSPVDDGGAHVLRLERHLDRAVRRCLETQDARGAWVAEPDPRLFDTMLVAYVLSRVEVPQAAAAVERAFLWMEENRPQDHDPVARLLDETPRQLLLGDPRPLDLRGPTLYSDIYRRKTLLLYTLALHAGVRVLSPYVPLQLKDQVKRFYERVDRIKTKQWNKVDLLSAYAILEALDGNLTVAAEVGKRLVAFQSSDGSFCHNPVSTAMAFLALSVALPTSAAWERS